MSIALLKKCSNTCEYSPGIIKLLMRGHLIPEIIDKNNISASIGFFSQGTSTHLHSFATSSFSLKYSPLSKLQALRGRYYVVLKVQLLAQIGLVFKKILFNMNIVQDIIYSFHFMRITIDGHIKISFFENTSFILCHSLLYLISFYPNYTLYKRKSF